jgi:D-alanine-D-alanine ligase
MELKSKKIGVLMGGMSSERDVSLKTGAAVCNALKEAGYNAVSIDVGKDIVRKIEDEKIDVAFIALHGKYGEDGTVQGILEIMGIPYTGSGVLGSAVSMNKIVSKELFERHGIPTPPYEVIYKKDYGKGHKFTIGFPLIVKPANGGSTIGVNIVDNAARLDSAIQDAFNYDDYILIEKFIDGIVLTAGVLEDTALPVIEVSPKKGFYDYESKYTPGMTEYFVPARIDKKKTEECQGLALKCHKVLRCRGITRTDIIMDKYKNLFVLEINTIPGMTATSLIPMAAKAAGIEFKTLLIKALEIAIKT